MIARRWWIGLAVALLLAGCEPSEYRLELHSLRRVDETVQAVVPQANARLAEPLLATVLGEGWRVHRAVGRDGVHLTFRRHRGTGKAEGLEVTRAVIGPLRLRYEYHLVMANPLAGLAANDFVKLALQNQDLPLTVRLKMPGTVLQNEQSRPGSVAEDGAGVWTFHLNALAAQPGLTLTAVSRAWRYGVLLAWALVVVMVFYVVGPELWPTEEKRERSAERRAARKAAREKRRAARDAKRAARPPKPEAPPRKPKRSRTAPSPEAGAAPGETPRRSRRGKPAPEVSPPADGSSEATGVPAGILPSTNAGRRLRLRRRQALIHQQARRRFQTRRRR